MSEAIIIVLISTMGGTMLTVLGAIIQQAMATKSANAHMKKQNVAHEEAKITTDEFRSENKGALGDLKEILIRQQKTLDRQMHINKVILRDKLRYLLRQHQDKESVTYADKEDVDMLYQIYADDGHNGTIRMMYEEFMKKKVV